MIVAVEFRDIGTARDLVAMAVGSGFRESGVTSVSGKGRVMVAIRCSIRMEVPLGRSDRILVSEEYVRYLVEVANTKMRENWRRMERFLEVLAEVLREKNALDHLKVTESKTVAVGQKMDLVFYTLQIGFFNMDFDLISKSIDKAKKWWSSETVAVVTGGNRGIGFEITRQLAEHGVTVILTSRDNTVGPEAAKVFQEVALNVFFHQLDIVDSESVKEFADWIQENYNGLDILINNAGVNYNVGSENSVEHAEQVINTNYYGTKRIIEAMIPLMKPSPSSAHIVNVSSRLGRLNGKRNRIEKETLREQLSDVDSLTEELIDNIFTENLLVPMNECRLFSHFPISPATVATSPANARHASSSSYSNDKGKFDELVEDKGVKILIDPKALMHVIGMKMDFIDDKLRSEFDFSTQILKDNVDAGNRS
ncbi:hypothetical protein Droror1_Dr00021444 [Drosera rotundifolia]